MLNEYAKKKKKETIFTDKKKKKVGKWYRAGKVGARR